MLNNIIIKVNKSKKKSYKFKYLYLKNIINMLYLVLGTNNKIAYSNTNQKWHLTNKSSKGK